MASNAYQYGLTNLTDGTIDYLTDTIKVMLCNSTYTVDKDDDNIDGGGANDALDGEIVATNYTGGWGGAGRKTLGSKTITTDNTDDETVFDAADPVWTSLGGAANDTITRAIVIWELTDDTASIVLVNNELSSSQLTNGSNVTIVYATEGILNINT